MLLAGELLLLIAHDASARLCVPPAQADAGLAGANLLRLALVNKVDLSREHDASAPGRVVVRDAAPLPPSIPGRLLEPCARTTRTRGP